MTNNTQLQRLTHLRRLARQIAATLLADFDREPALQMHAHRLLEWQHDGTPRPAKLRRSGGLP